MLPDEVSSSPEEIEEVFSLFEPNGIAIVDDAAASSSPARNGEPARAQGNHRQRRREARRLRAPGEDQRPGAHVPARDGHRAAAHARGRGAHRPPHRARRAARPERALPQRYVLDEIRQLGERIKKGQVSANLFAGAKRKGRRGREEARQRAKLGIQQHQDAASRRSRARTRRCDAPEARRPRLEVGPASRPRGMRVQVAREFRAAGLWSPPRSTSWPARCVDADAKIKRHERSAPAS